jgi:hypothetical protein
MYVDIQNDLFYFGGAEMRNFNVLRLFAVGAQRHRVD